MKKHQLIFEKIKTFLSEQFGEALNEYEEGTHLTIGETGIWISVDDSELTIGYGMNHKHYQPEYDEITEFVNEFSNLLTRQKGITVFYKGEFAYKNKVEIENSEGEFKELGTSLTWLFPYWKKTRVKIRIEPSLIDSSKVEREIVEIKNYVRQNV